MMERVHSQQLLKSINQQKILQLIFKKGPIFRAELAKQSGLTQQTVTNIVNRLLEEEIVVEGEPISGRGGRKPVPLTVNEGSLYAIGIEVAVKYVRGILVNFKNEPLAKSELQEFVFENEDDFLGCICRVIDGLMRRVPNLEKLKGIGISIQGLVDSKEGVLISASWLKRFSRIGIKKELEKKYPVPVYVENDVNLLAIIEVLEGRLADSTNSITLKLDYGIGGAIVIGKQLYDGSSHVAGEFGHYKAFRGEYAHPCHCGSYGCLTTLASVSGLRNNMKLSLEEFNDRLRSGEESANRLFNEIQEAVGLSLSNIVTFLNPDHVLLTGKMIAVLGDLLVPAIQRRLFSTIPESCKGLKFLHVPELVDEPALSAALVKYHFFEIPLESLSL